MEPVQYIIDLIDSLKSNDRVMDKMFVRSTSLPTVGLEREENSWKISAKTSSSRIFQPEFPGLEISSRTFM